MAVQRHEVSGKAVLKIAARGVKAPSSLTLREIKAVCASVLTQAPPKRRSLSE